jgi:hypothetical protein
MNHPLSEKLREMLDHGSTMESALAELRASGASVVDCILAVQLACGHDLRESKEIVHLSQAWSDVKEEHDQFHDSVARAVTNDGSINRSQE